jgi:ribosomal protein S18 acetylase RimI-like enzyme
MHIRRYRPDDLEVLRRLTVEAFPGVSINENIEKRYGPINGRDWRWRMARQIDADVETHAAGIFLAVEDGTAAGAGEQILGFVTTGVDREAGIGHISHLVVTAENRGRGLGRQLVEYALDYFRRLGLTHAQIETLEQNVVGQRLFPACGFEEVARKIYYARRL